MNQSCNPRPVDNSLSANRAIAGAMSEMVGGVGLEPTVILAPKASGIAANRPPEINGSRCWLRSNTLSFKDSYATTTSNGNKNYFLTIGNSISKTPSEAFDFLRFARELRCCLKHSSSQ